MQNEIKKAYSCFVSRFCTISILTVSIVYAASSSKNSGVGEAWCTATKQIVKGSSYWDAYVRSSCDLGIGVIGRTWWTVRQLCIGWGVYLTDLSYSGEVYQNSNYYQRVVSPSYKFCSSGPSQLQNQGGHDFQSLSGTWQPYVEHLEGY